jgi:hypothetical protein
LAVPKKLKYGGVFFLLKMHRNVDINNKMLFWCFMGVIKAVIIAEKNFITHAHDFFFPCAMLAAFITQINTKESGSSHCLDKMQTLFGGQ